MASKTVNVLFGSDPVSGHVEITNGELAALKLSNGKGKVRGNQFHMLQNSAKLTITVARACLKPGANPTAVRIVTEDKPFTFFLRDVDSAQPIFIAPYKAAVTTATDRRSYEQIEADTRGRHLQSIHDVIESEPEETYENACAVNRNLMCPTWLGLSRDMRFFEVAHNAAGGNWGYIQPRHHSTASSAPETDGHSYNLQFVVGVGAACRVKIERRLEEGVLPILHSTQSEEPVNYNITAFATLETQPINLKSLRGSEWEACYPNTGGCMLSEEDRARIAPLMETEMHGREEETVCWIRIEAVNTASTPHYAWIKAPSCSSAGHGGTHYDGKHGFSTFKSGRVISVNRLDGRPAPQAEMAILLPPGGKIVYDMLVPHQPLSVSRSKKLAHQDFNKHVAACRRFWTQKLAAAAAISVPEPAVNERIKAGLLHCDIVALGKEPDGPVLATIGWYAPIGSESSPIIQFFDSMGWHKLAERSLQFFLERQQENGFIQNFGGYQLETGPALWTMGEHYRYTRNKAWVRKIKPNLLKACDFLLAWRKRNKRPELKGRGYGLLDGKVADPEDFFHSFMLNSLSYLGIQRVAEMLADIDAVQARRLMREARAFRKDIRTAYFEAMGRSPVIPLDDGTWIPTMPPWAEYAGPVALYADGGDWHTHGSFGSRDSLIGSLYLVIGEVLEPDEAGTEFLLRTHQQLFTARNAGLSQPYYCRHDYIHLLRGEVKEFLKTYYNQFTALQDRETYTFWEHYFGASQHKTHEEGWFLMQTRWMLWMEDGPVLRLLPGIPRRWMEDGKTIELKDVASYFGRFTLRVQSQLNQGCIHAEIECRGKHRPAQIQLRLPHPKRQCPVTVKGGRYDAESETVTISSFSGTSRVEIEF